MIAKINIHHVHMIDIGTGDSFNNSVYVNKTDDISADEFDKMIGTARVSHFKYVGTACERLIMQVM